MDRANRPNGYTVPEKYKEVQAGHLERDPDEDIRVSLDSIRKEIEETNRTLKRIAEGLERGRR